MKTMGAVLFTLLLVSLSQAQQTWIKTYGGPKGQAGYSVQQTTDGGYIVAGETWSYGAGRYDFYLIKTNSSGDTLWTRTYGGWDDEEANSVQQTSDGGYIVAGYTYSFGAGDADVYLVKTDKNGDTLWTRTYGGPSLERGTCVQQTTDGGYIVTGYTMSFVAGSGDVYLIKTDTLGNENWSRTYGGTGYDAGNAVQQTTDGGYVIAGWTNSFGGGGSEVYLIKTNSYGDTLWTRTYGTNRANSVQQTSDGGYIVAGSNSHVYLVKTNASGDTLWTRTYQGGTGYGEGYSVQQTTDGGYIVAGYTVSSNGDVYLIKTNASGDTLWTRTFGGTSADESFSVQQTSDRGYIVAGYTFSYGPVGYVYLIKTDTLGRSSGVEEETGRSTVNVQRSTFKITPNPFVSFARVPGHEGERFSLYDVVGRKVGTYPGDRVGEGLRAGVYFLRPEGGNGALLRLVKVR
jgi:hypothetical protein